MPRQKTGAQDRHGLPPPRLIIAEITPAVGCGGFAAKAAVGESVPVRARIFSDGRPSLRARVRWRAGTGRGGWTAAAQAPLTEGYEDYWHGALRPDSIGPARFRIEAWEDRFGTWRDDVLRRLRTGVDASPELASGWNILASLSPGLARERQREVGRAARELHDAPPDAQLAFLLAEDLGGEMADLEPCQTMVASEELPLWVDRTRALFGSWYELFPRSQGAAEGRSGTLAATRQRLPQLAELGFDVLYLTPIHPVGRTGRRGPNNSPIATAGDPGSPWAIGSEAGGHTSIDPALGTVEDFHQLLLEAQRLEMEVALDYALQCSPDHPWVREHPDWFARRPDGSIRPADNPPKRYDDIFPLDFSCPDWRQLWEACYQVLEFWTAQGVRIFRVDNPHTKPVPFWEFVIDRLRRDHPDVLLLAEAFTRPAMMRRLGQVGFSQSYTYFTWRNTRSELTDYVTELASTADFLRPNFFVNTPDILTEVLQAGGPGAFRMRLLLAATMSSNYGIYSGFEHLEGKAVREGSEEYLDSEKYQFRPRPSAGDPWMLDLIRRLNRSRREHPALQQFRRVFFHWADDPQVICFSKRDHAGDDQILAVVNLDPRSTRETTVHLDPTELGIDPHRHFGLVDLLDGAEYSWRGTHNYVLLDPERRPGHLFWVRP